MPRPTKHDPDLGDARGRLLAAAIDLIRRQGFAATSVEAFSMAAGVTKVAFFHHFPDKAALGAAVADHWARTTGAFFAAAPYHALTDPVDRLLAYVGFRRAVIADDIAACSCLAATLLQEIHLSHPAAARAAGAAILGHAATLEPDCYEALAAAGQTSPSAESLARHCQTVIQGAFVMAKTTGDAALAREALDHLDRYIRLLFKRLP